MATAVAYSDSFVNTSGWTASNISVSSGAVQATTDNVNGSLLRNYESVAAGSLARIGFDFVIDTSMTANTVVSVSVVASTGGLGWGIYVKQGVGIVCDLYNNGAVSGIQPTVMLAWASLINGGRYHVEMTCNPSIFFSFYSLYDPSGKLVLNGSGSRSVNFSNNNGWFQMTQVLIQSNSSKTTMSRFAIDPAIIGSSTTAKYFSNTCTFTQFPSASAGNWTLDFYIPGGGIVNELLVYFHGSGQSPNFIEMTNIDTGWAVIDGFLAQGCMLVVPQIPDGLGSGGSENWANDYGTATVVNAISLARTTIGNPNAPQHYLSYSMGTLMAGRLIGNEGQTNVQSWYILRGCLDIAYLEQNLAGFTSGIDTAWGTTKQASYAAAQAFFARGNPMGLLTSNPGPFSNVAILLDYGTTGDTVVPQTQNCVAFDALLTTKNIPHKNYVATYETHTERTTAGDAMAHLSQVEFANAQTIYVAAIRGF